MKRIAGHVAVFLLIGASVNVMVAWACALWSPIHRGSPPTFDTNIPADVAATIPPEWLIPSPGHAFFTCYRDAYWGVGLRVVRTGIGEAIPGETTIGPGRVMHVHRSGWPWGSLTCTGYLDWSMVQVPWSNRPAKPQKWAYGFSVPGLFDAQPVDSTSFWLPYRHPLPLRPLWLGFAGNTAAYAVGVCVVARLPRAVRRAVRRSRGSCVVCGYPVGVSPVCTECGRPVRVVESA